uniref:DUF4771 domain-containing protein n=1 Tax=Sipha flava TaxID=143950 RepID=A0A2S2Q8N5_9HEMI
MDNWWGMRAVEPKPVTQTATLEFLSNMGDPIAGFPELTKLYNLQIWYQKRLNINRHMTSKYKQNLMDKSVTIWKVPVPKLTTVTIPKLKLKSNTLTWGQISSTKQEIKRAKAEYTTNLKRTAIDNARNMYLSTYNDYFENGLNKNFKRTFFAYFPAKEDDCMFENPPKIFNEKA